MVSGALGSAVFSAVTVVLLTRRNPLVLEGVPCCEVAAHLHRRQASIRRQDGASLDCSSYYIFLDELLRIPVPRTPRVNKGNKRKDWDSLRSPSPCFTKAVFEARLG